MYDWVFYYAEPLVSSSKNNQKNQRSTVAYLLRVLADVFFYLAVIGTLGTTVTLIFTDESLSRVNSWPVSTAINKVVPYNIEIATLLPIELNSRSTSMINRGEIRFSSSDWPHYSLIYLVLLYVKLLIVVFIAHFLRHIFYSVENGQPFTVKSYHRLKYIALLLLLMFGYSLTYSFLHHWYIMNYVGLAKGEFVSSIWTLIITFKDFQLSEYQMLLHNKHSLVLVYCAACVYVLALVFREGCRLKQDSDSIV